MKANSIGELLIQLDMALTGKDRRTAEHTARNQPADKFLAERIYYLSDGGYSRIAMNYEGQLWPTSNSLDRVKQVWSKPDVQQIVTAISREVTMHEREREMLDALQAMLDAYAPRAEVTAAKEGESSLHSAVQKARRCIRLYSEVTQ